MLIKVVVQVIPIYDVSVFNILIRLWEDIQKAVARFGWRKKGTKKKKNSLSEMRKDESSQSKGWDLEIF